jgi:hypothetical protein
MAKKTTTIRLSDGMAEVLEVASVMFETTQSAIIRDGLNLVLKDFFSSEPIKSTIAREVAQAQLAKHGVRSLVQITEIFSPDIVESLDLSVLRAPTGPEESPTS